MKEFKIGDKVKVKENFWEIQSDESDESYESDESDVSVSIKMKILAGKTLEVESVYYGGDVRTKQDGSNKDTHWIWYKNWLELYTEPSKEITWDTLKWKDVVINEDGDERIVLDVRNDLVDLSYDDDFDTHGSTFHKKELQKYGYTIKQPTPEKLELTLDQVAEKFGVDVTNIKIKE